VRPGPDDVVTAVVAHLGAVRRGELEH
jgi:gluconokinase